MKTLTEHFNNISVKKGDFFLVELAANNSTGYSWGLEVTAGQAKLISTVYIPDNVAVDIVGGSATERWLYLAEAEGPVEIKAEYKRGWEKTPPAKSIHLQAQVG